MLTSDPADARRIAEEMDVLDILFALIEAMLSSPEVMKVIQNNIAVLFKKKKKRHIFINVCIYINTPSCTGAVMYL